MANEMDFLRALFSSAVALVCGIGLVYAFARFLIGNEWGDNSSSKLKQPNIPMGKSVDKKGRPVYRIRAKNYMEASQYTNGKTYPGNVYTSISKQADGTWIIRQEDFRV